MKVEDDQMNAENMESNGCLQRVHEYGHHVSNSLRYMKGKPGFEYDFYRSVLAFEEYFGGVSPREFAKIFGNKFEKILRSV